LILEKEMKNRPFVGVAVIVQKNGKVLLGQRKNAHGAGIWAFPGGHLEYREAIEACAIREVFEETNLTVKDIKHIAFTNDIFRQEKKHYVTLFVSAQYDSGDLEIKEPDKCEKWDWFHWDKYPEPMFLPLKNFIQQGHHLNQILKPE
jgi:8-oxo-dGTP diphosphatase